MKLFEAIAQNAGCLGDSRFVAAAESRAKRIADRLPSGSGFDSGTTLEFADDHRIVFTTAFHHMHESGMYDGWTEHRVTVRASFSTCLEFSIGGRNRNEIKDYIAQVFESCLSESFDWIEVKHAQS